MRERALAAIAAITAVLVTAACTAMLHGGAHGAAAAARTAAVPRVSARMAGIVTPDLGAFDKQCRCAPGLAVRYIRWGESARSANLAYDLEHGAVPLAELQPYGVTLGQVAGGSQDGYLKTFARQVAALRSRVLMSFAAEVNNDSYPWGYRHASPRAFVRAWRHVVTVFRRAGAANVRWVLVVNYSSSHTERLSSVWPGAAYVDMAGVDGYAMRSSVTFRSLFGPTIAQLRRLGRVPVMITETGASPLAGKARWMSQLTGGLSTYRLRGFVWFNINQRTRRGGNDWRLEDDPAALAAFRAAVKEYGP